MVGEGVVMRIRGDRATCLKLSQKAGFKGLSPKVIGGNRKRIPRAKCEKFFFRNLSQKPGFSG